MRLTNGLRHHCAVTSLAILAVALGLAVPGAPGAADSRQRPAFEVSISKIDPATRARMTGVSWRRGCPVLLRDLRLLRVTYWGFDRKAHNGRLVVNESAARGIGRVMRTLYRNKFPIRRMRLVDAYGANDRRSMGADNTSAFNCRFVSGTSRWSQHAYGLAIDINPIENPYVSGGYVSPPAGAPFAGRPRKPGVIRSGGAVVRAFAGIGWPWGGYWSPARDFQHFSDTGT